MKFFIKDISKACVVYFARFRSEYNLCDWGETYALFCHSMRSILKLEIIEYNKMIEEYGEKCEKYLLENIKGLNYFSKGTIEMRSALFNYSNCMYVATDILTERRANKNEN